MKTKTLTKGTALAFFTISVLVFATSESHAGDVFKTANANALNVGTSWVGSTAPMNIDVAVWSSSTGNPTAAQCRNAPLGGTVSWAGIRLENPAGNVVITNATPQQLTNGTSGVVIASGTRDLYLGVNVVLGASQLWNSLTANIFVTNQLSGAWGNDLTISNTATANNTGTHLQASNTFAGTVFHNFGEFFVDHSFGLGNCTNVVVNSIDATSGRGGGFNAGTVFGLGNASISSAVSLSLTSCVSPAISSTLFCSSGSSTWNGPINLSGANGTVVLNNSGNTLNLPGNITGTPSSVHFRGAGSTIVSGTLNFGAGELRKRDSGGVLTINSSGNTWGITTLLIGTIIAGVNGALPATTIITNETSASAAALDLAGHTQTVAGLYRTGSGPLSVTNSSPTTATLTFSSSATDTFSGQLVDGAGKLALTVNGGTLILTGPNTYSGATRLNTGKLVVPTTQTGGGAFTNADGTTLGVAVSAGTSLNVSVLTLGASVGATNEFTFNSNPTVPAINATNLTTHGPITVNILGGGLNVGQITLIKYAGSIGGDGYTFALGALPSAVSATLSNNTANLSVDLVVTAAPGVVWRGQVSADWDIATTPNWLDTATSLPATYIDGNSVRFDDTAAGTTSVNLFTNVAPGGVLVTNAALTYTFGGTNGITGGGGLTKDGPGVLVVSNNANSYSGNTIIVAGTFRNGAAGVIPNGVGKGNVTVNGTWDLAGFTETINGLSGSGIVDNAGGGGSILTVGDNTASSTFSGVLTNSIGTLALAKTGSGTITLTGANGHSGGTTLSVGTLRLGNDSAAGLGTLTLSGGVLSSDGATAHTISNNVSVTANITLGSPVDNGILTFGGAVDLGASQKNITMANDIIWTGSAGNGAVGKFGQTTWSLRGGSFDFNSATAVREGNVIIDGAAVTQNNSAMRVDCSIVNGLSRLTITNGGSLTAGSSSNLRVGWDNGVPSATNVVDISGTVDLQGTSGDNGKVQIGTSTARGIVNLRANGLLRTRAIEHLDNASEFNFDGGTLQANAVPLGNTFMQGLTLATVKAGGAFIDSAAQNIRIAQPLLDGGGSGGLVKLGSGKLSLNGTNTYTGMTIVSNGTLGGIGGISGPLQVVDFSEVAPGSAVSGLGTFTVSNSVTFAATATCTMELNRASSPNSDRLVANSVTAGGTLNIVNIGTALDAGDSFDLFDGAFGGAFTATNLPALSSGLFWDTSQLGVSGIIRVVGLKFGAPKLIGSQLVMSNTGPANATYWVRASTNIALAIPSWDYVATNVFDASGNSTFTNTVNPATPQRFFLLELP